MPMSRYFFQKRLLPFYTTALCALWLVFAPLAYTQQVQSTGILIEQWPTGPKHRGVRHYGVYQVFPENRAENGLYVKNTLLVVAPPQQTLTAAYPFTEKGDVAYLTQSRTQARTLKIHLAENNRLAQLKQLASNVYYVVMVLDGVVYKKMLRTSSQRIEDFLPRVKRAHAPIAGEAGVVFYHINAYDAKTDDSPALYGMRLHFVAFDGSPLRHFPHTIKAPSAALNLRWTTPTKLRVQSKGRPPQTIATSSFQ